MMQKLLAMTILAACALLADGQTVWRFEATEGDGEQGADAAAKTQKKTPKTGDTPDFSACERSSLFSGGH